jgi:membrane fusion protein (multidrug efflux system)
LTSTGWSKDRFPANICKEKNNRLMKYIIPFFLVLTLAITSCGGPVEEVYPEDLEGKKVLLKTKKQELSEVTELISKLEQEIAELDPNVISDNRTAVTTAMLGKENFDHYVEIQGTVQADDYIDVTSEVAGRILKMTLEEGDNVRAGQLVATIDLEQLQKQIDEVKKSQELAITIYERQKRLWDQNIGSEIQFLEAKNNKERLEKSLETLNYQLTKAKVYAPVSGVVERVILQGGELAAPGAPIIQILNPNKLKVVADVPETYLRAVTKGTPVKVAFPALDEEQQANVTQVGRTIDPANRTFEVEARIRKSSALIKPNLLAVMFIKDYAEKDVVTVPLELVQQEIGGKDYVFVMEQQAEATVAKKVYVKTGKSYAGTIIIEEGLQGNEKLIIEGARDLADGELVKEITQG